MTRRTVVTTTDEGVAGGVATLDTSGRVPVAQLPTDQLAQLAANLQAATDTLVASDAGRLIESNTASTMVITVPADATVNFPIGTLIRVLRISGATSIAPAAGVSFRLMGLANLRRWGVAYLRKRAVNDWEVWGDFLANPVTFTDLSPSATLYSPDGFVIQGGRVIDPTALFGPGVGASVLIDAQALLDFTAGNTGYWYHSVYNGAALLAQDCGQVSTASTRVILRATTTLTVAAGATATITGSTTAPGVSNTQVKCYPDPSNNRLQCTVTPVYT